MVGKINILAILAFVCFGCQNQDPERQLERIGGYWEIESVTMEDGTIKNFGANPTIDFIELNNQQGLRKKLAIRLDGSFYATKDAERFTVQIENNQVQLKYNTAYDQWTETVLKAQDSLLVLQNAEGKQYTYKRFVPINIDLEHE